MSTPPESYKNSGIHTNMTGHSTDRPTETFVTVDLCDCGSWGVHICKILAYPTEVAVTAAKLDSGPSLEEVKARLSELSSTLEKNLKDVSDQMESEDNYTEFDDYHFDAGFTAGLRVALNEIAKLSESL